jgi:hypothetical protein
MGETGSRVSEAREGGDAANFGADTELALSLERRTCYFPRMWRAANADAGLLGLRVARARESGEEEAAP